jgi:hypothetical protein
MKDDLAVTRAALEGGGASQYVLILGVSGALLIGSVSPVTGLLLAGWAITSSLAGAAAKGRSVAAVITGDKLHALSGDDFNIYKAQLGKDADAELRRAVAKGLPLTPDARRYIKFLDSQQRVTKVTNGATAQPAQPAVAQPPGEPPIFPMEVAAVAQPPGEPPIFPMEVAARSNLFVLGIGGAGKGMLVSNLIRVAQSDPRVKVFVIDPKGEAGEAGYWETADRLVSADIQKLDSVTDWLNSALDQYTDWLAEVESANGRGLLIIDELFALGHHLKRAKYNRVADLIVTIASLGGCKNRKIWLITQTPYVGGVGLNLSQASQIPWVAIAQRGQNLRAWKASHLPPLDNLDQLTSASPVGRAISFGSQWFPMPRLTNYSKIDRDGCGDSVWDNIKCEPLIQQWDAQIAVEGIDGFTAKLTPVVAQRVREIWSKRGL